MRALRYTFLGETQDKEARCWAATCIGPVPHLPEAGYWKCTKILQQLKKKKYAQPRRTDYTSSAASSHKSKAQCWPCTPALSHHCEATSCVSTGWHSGTKVESVLLWPEVKVYKAIKHGNKELRDQWEEPHFYPTAHLFQYLTRPPRLLLEESFHTSFDMGRGMGKTWLLNSKALSWTLECLAALLLSGWSN